MAEYISRERCKYLVHPLRNLDKLLLAMVAILDDLPVGMCSLWEKEDLDINHGPWLGTLVVDPIYQGKGIGKELVKSIKSQAKIMKYNKIYLFTSDMAGYYSNLGWSGVKKVEYKGKQVEIMEILV